MSLPSNYGKRVKSSIGATAVWLPGISIELGSIMLKDNGRFKLAAHLTDFTAVMKSRPQQDRSLDLSSKGTRQRLIQAGVELPSTAKLDLTAEATVKFEFDRAFEYVLKTPTLKGEHITNILQIAREVTVHPEWRHGDFHIVHELYEADQFTFLGTESTKRKFEFTGKGAGILSLLTAGASVGLSKSGDVDLKILGKGGPLAMNLVRIKKDGKTDFIS